MAIDFSWLINACNAIVTNINSFFSGIWSSVGQIVNVGQGVYAGLVNFGAWLYQGLVDAFKWIWDGLTAVGNYLWQGLMSIGTGILNAFTWIGTQLYNFGQWLWAGIQGFANMILNGIIYIANSVYGFFVSVYNTLWTFIVGFKTSIDQWWHDTIVGFRTKLKQSIMFSVTTDIVWKSSHTIPDRLMSAKNMNEMGTGLIGALGAIIVAPITGFLLAEMLDLMVPTPTSTIYKVTPDLGAMSLTPPTLEEKYPIPQAPTAPGAITVGVGVSPVAAQILMGSIDKLMAVIVPVSAAIFTEDVESLTPTVTVTPELTLI